ncbi:MAG: potassium channel family protein [Vulcanimicrobiaceae bacterium]
MLLRSIAAIIPKRLVVVALALLSVIAVSTAGYVAIEGWSWFDSLYMVLTTITTIGGGEPVPLSKAGKYLTAAVIVLGVGTTTFSFIAVFEFLLEGHLGSAVGRRRILERVRALKDHYVLCGFGRVGREIAREWVAEKVPFVVIDINQQSLEDAVREGYLVIEGNASDVDVLRTAGVERAQALVAATDSDADNVYVTLSARVLRPNIFIVARANKEDSHAKLRLAGASRIISPYHIGGRRMASLAMRPTAVEFIDTILQAGNSELLLEDLTIERGSGWIGKTLASLVGQASEAIVLALKRGNHMTFRPPQDTVLEAGDEIVAAGPRQAVHLLKERM